LIGRQGLTPLNGFQIWIYGDDRFLGTIFGATGNQMMSKWLTIVPDKAEFANVTIAILN
jgi:hypothetical protein